MLAAAKLMIYGEFGPGAYKKTGAALKALPALIISFSVFGMFLKKQAKNRSHHSK